MDYKQLGYENTSILMSNYIKEIHHPLEIKKDIDVVFIGHYEDDGRDQTLLKLVKEIGCNLGIWGSNWISSPLFEELRNVTVGEFTTLFNEDYCKTLNRAKIALVFFSKINNDGYTRRCFEIPATGTFMLCEDAPQTRSMFSEGVEAAYFRSSEELIDKVNKYLQNNELREKIASAGFERLKKDGHEIHDRAKEVLKKIIEITS